MAVVTKSNIGGAIIALFLPSNPPAILWLIISVIIYTIQRQSIWAFAHICKKILELAPSLANRYASFLIVFVPFTAWLIASGNHISPRSVCLGSATLSGAGVAVSSSISNSFSHNRYSTTR